jgi:hypothetical protein
MGHQQLLLIILITILVGIATIVAINNMQSSHDASVYEAIQQDIIQAQSQSIAFQKKALMMGGGGGSYIGITLDDILLPEENENASYQLDNITQDSFTILATTVYGFSVEATINGEEISWERNTIEP